MLFLFESFIRHPLPYLENHVRSDNLDRIHALYEQWCHSPLCEDPTPPALNDNDIFKQKLSLPLLLKTAKKLIFIVEV